MCVDMVHRYFMVSRRLANTDLRCSIIRLKLMLDVRDDVTLKRLSISWAAECTASMRLLMLCLLTCVAYLVTFRMETMCTSMSHCEDWVAMSWFILVLILCMSLVVAVPVNQLRAVPKNGSKLLLCLVVCCCWFELSRFTADAMRVSWDLYKSCIFASSNCRVVISNGEADGWRSREVRNCFVLASCHLKSFQWCSSCPSDMWAMTIQESHVGYACRTGWNSTNSPGSVCGVVVTGVNVSMML